ncbi:hypothetical protein CAPTEDRAFT_219820 [Capitella teleta]|uniref:Uncharacterized protein n=1 Tax=Capitella teleta TaxID=283909 RepID=R7U2M2_CAPTE|nr:hypothetical protein CAPTEDRAFT_219820 [Capitella teleta]|eukprot:ELT97896.1 hypothetical protein CAPTEDRAFT_219820 [Capitella teleta]
MVFRRWVMMKMFMAAVGSGQVVLALMSIFPGIKDKMLKAMEEYGGCFSEKGLLTSILGPFILGMGMTLSGARLLPVVFLSGIDDCEFASLFGADVVLNRANDSIPGTMLSTTRGTHIGLISNECPGMVLAQVGSWTNNAIYTFIGTLIGALLYGLVAPFVIRLTRPKKPFEILTVHEKLNVRYVYLALPMALAIGVVVFLLEYFIPWQDDIDCWNRNEFATPGANIFTMKSWSPGVSGAVIGVLQVAIVLAVGDTLGGSSSYVTIVSQWVITERLQSMFPYLARARCGIGNWWQVFYVLAAVAGGALSSWGSDSIGTAPGVSVTTAIFGGILLLLGARLAAGCTSGHGLSGMGLLYWFSFLAVPAMFAGGIALAFAMDATGALSDYHFHDVAVDIPLENCANFTMN